MFNVPILILAFNRPDTTARVLAAIQSVQAKQIYVCVDGARSDKAGEAKKVQAVRDLFNGLDWNVEVHRLFREQNLGCRDSVNGGINWFFEQVEYGIILEDDCLPDASFFPFCKNLLAKYKDDNRVFHIAGFNPMTMDKTESYLFSNFCLIWGWATWRRAWQQNDTNFGGLEELGQSAYFEKALPNKAARAYMIDKFENIKDGTINSWDYTWFHSILQKQGLCIIPSKSLIENIGLGGEATHTSKNEFGTIGKKASTMSFPLKHPDSVGEPLPAENLQFFYTTQKKQWLLLVNQIFPKKLVRMVGSLLDS